jgi:chloramphenicol 3-O phosphotransferase
VLLNGASSSGKTSLAKALQASLPDLWLRASIDDFVPMFDARYIAFDPPLDHPAREGLFVTTAAEGEPPALVLHPGPRYRAFISGMQQAVCSLVSAGSNVIFDDVLYDVDYVRGYVRVFADIDVLFVGVRCPLEVNEQREKTRGDRAIGHARGHFELTHAAAEYDIEVDTSRHTSVQCAARIAERLASGTENVAFSRLRSKLSGVG